MNDGPTVAQIETRIQAALKGLDPAQTEVCSSIRSLLRTRDIEIDAVAFIGQVSHAEGGTSDQAITIAASHHLWWLAAHVMDDVIDRGDLTYSGSISSERAVMAAMVCATTLAYNILLTDQPRHAVALAVLLGQAWSMSNDGQIRDVESHALRSTESDIALAYLHKNGAAYGMAAASSALVAGAPPERVELWRQFGVQYGALGQCRNDQEDLFEERHEDLQNATATLHTTVALSFYRDQDEQAYRMLHDFFLRAEHSPSESSAAASLLLDPRVVSVYLDHIATQRTLTIAALDTLAVGESDRSELICLVNRSADPLQLLTQAYA